MSEISLSISEREGLGKGVARRLRAQGMIPAVLYGKRAKPLSVSVNPRALYKAVSTESGLNALIHITVEGKNGGEKATVLVKDLQIDPIKRTYLHADFLQVDLQDEVKVQIPVRLLGKAIGQKEGGIIQHVCRELEVFCRVNAIPKSIEVDISDLEIGDSLHLAAIKLPAGVRSASTLDVTLVVCVPPEKEEVVAPPVDAAAALTAEGAAAVPGAPGAAPAAPGAAPAAGAPAAAAPAGKEGGKGKETGGKKGDKGSDK